MRIGVICDFGVNVGGGECVMLNILETLSNVGYNVFLLTSNPRGLNKVAKFFDESMPNVNESKAKISFGFATRKLLEGSK